ncbi:hypothetical protein WJX72_000284 [[Myrmecia] bisecta]|uniref:Calcineurin-like phosphoesterase domain-containing protein n=1 Tax=[Myrmecia] bisecta TaxID=41462 RepID=A0AAW1R4N6_9CHLO
MAGSASLPARKAGHTLIAVVGDVHGHFDGLDAHALRHLGADVCCVVGDLGEEDLQLVERIGALDGPKAVILGNHDAWYHLTERSRKRKAAAGLIDTQQHPYASIHRQLEALGESDVGYASLSLPDCKLSIVGGRPFSSGGSSWGHAAQFYADVYGISSVHDSAKYIAARALEQPPDHALVLLAHNGPAGLGSQRHDICGVDWLGQKQGDHGDPDLELAIEAIRFKGRTVPLVLFGHMHHRLNTRSEAFSHTSNLRNMVQCDPAGGTMYINCAVCPRHRRRDGAVERHFVLVELAAAAGVVSAYNVWLKVAVGEEPGGRVQCEVSQVQPLVKTEGGSEQHKASKLIWQAYSSTWTRVQEC